MPPHRCCYQYSTYACPRPLVHLEIDLLLREMEEWSNSECYWLRYISCLSAEKICTHLRAHHSTDAAVINTAHAPAHDVSYTSRSTYCCEKWKNGQKVSAIGSDISYLSTENICSLTHLLLSPQPTISLPWTCHRNVWVTLRWSKS